MAASRLQGSGTWLCTEIMYVGQTVINQTVNDGVAHSRIGTLDQPVAA